MHFVAATIWLNLLFQLSLEFERLKEIDIRSKFDGKLSTYALNILSVKCTVRKETLLCYKLKYHFPEEREKHPESFYIHPIICFKFQIFIPNLKLPLWVILTLSTKEIMLPFKLTIFI